MDKSKFLKSLKEAKKDGTRFVTYGESDLGIPVAIDDAIVDIESMNAEYFGDCGWYACDETGRIEDSVDFGHDKLHLENVTGAEAEKYLTGWRCVLSNDGAVLAKNNDVYDNLCGFCAQNDIDVDEIDDVEFEAIADAIRDFRDSTENGLVKFWFDCVSV